MQTRPFVRRLKEAGAVAIADFVKQGKKLTELNLYMNDIGDNGAYKVCCESSCLVAHKLILSIFTLLCPLVASITAMCFCISHSEHHACDSKVRTFG